MATAHIPRLLRPGEEKKKCGWLLVPKKRWVGKMGGREEEEEEEEEEKEEKEKKRQFENGCSSSSLSLSFSSRERRRLRQEEGRVARSSAG